MELFMEALLDAVIDTVKLIPFLFLTYVAMEYLERKTEEKQIDLLEKTGRLAPVFGGIAGIVPQCGFSASAASLYSGGVISVGAMLAVFLSTSDEMLPILISRATAPGSIIKIVITKAAIGVASGLIVDFCIRVMRMHSTKKHIHDLCEREHCSCEDEGEGILIPALKHTLHILLFIFVISFFITLVVEGLGEDVIASLLEGKPVIGVLLSGIVGLIPNCAASIAITELYLRGILSTGQMMAGLLVGAGVGLLVLFRTNNHLKDNLKITGILYLIGVSWGLLFELLQIRF